MRLLLWCALPATILALVGAVVTFRSDDPSPHVPIALFLWSLVWCAVIVGIARSGATADDDPDSKIREPMSLDRVDWWRVTGWLYPAAIWIWIALGTFFDQYATCASWFGSYATGRAGMFLCVRLPSLAVFTVLMIFAYGLVCLLRAARRH